MGAVVILLLLAVVLVACTPRRERAFALGSILAVGAVVLLAVRINLHRVIGDLVGDGLALAFRNRDDLLLVFAAAVVLIVPLAMIWMSVRDQIDKRAAVRLRRRLKGLGFRLRSEHPPIWSLDEESSRRPARSARRT